MQEKENSNIKQTPKGYKFGIRGMDIAEMLVAVEPSCR